MRHQPAIAAQANSEQLNIPCSCLTHAPGVRSRLPGSRGLKRSNPASPMSLKQLKKELLCMRALQVAQAAQARAQRPGQAGARGQLRRV